MSKLTMHVDEHLDVTVECTAVRREPSRAVTPWSPCSNNQDDPPLGIFVLIYAHMGFESRKIMTIAARRVLADHKDNYGPCANWYWELETGHYMVLNGLYWRPRPLSPGRDSIGMPIEEASR